MTRHLPVIGPTDDLRAVLNAGWLVRVRMELDKSGDDGPLDLLGRRLREQLYAIVHPGEPDSIDESDVALDRHGGGPQR